MILLVGLWVWLWVRDRVLFVKVCIFHNQKMHFYLILNQLSMCVKNLANYKFA